MDYIPRSEPVFDDWASNFINNLSATPDEFKATAEELALLTQRQTDWQSAYDDLVRLQAELEAGFQKKNDTRKAFESLLRSHAQRIKTDPDIASDRKTVLGINLPSTSSRRRIAVPTTRPLPRIKASDRLQHVIYFADEETPTRRGKPAGASGCEIWVKLGGAVPNNISELRFLGLTSSPPYVVKYTGDEGGQTAHYMLRWANLRNETGPWSSTISAIVQS